MLQVIGEYWSYTTISKVSGYSLMQLIQLEQRRMNEYVQNSKTFIVHDVEMLL